MIHPYELNAKDECAFALLAMKKLLKLEANGHLCHTDMVSDVRMTTSAECRRVKAVCADLKAVADSNTQPQIYQSGPAH